MKHPNTTIQNLILTKELSRSDLYFRREVGDRPVQIMIQHDNSLRISNGEVVSFDTYFNTFFEHYITNITDIADVVLNLKISGNGILEVFRHFPNRVPETLVFDHFNTNDKIIEFKKQIDLESSHNKGSRVSFRLSGCDGGLTLFQGKWETEVDVLRPVRLNVVICTFKKLKYLDRVVARLKNAEDLFQGCDWELSIVDNASEISKDRYNSGKITIYHQVNSGGAGGFTRGIIEAIREKREKERKPTHVLLMDDDIDVEPECIFRTIRYLEYAKKNVCIGGGMLDLHRPTVLHEQGALLWNRESFIHVDSKFCNLDLVCHSSLGALQKAQDDVTYNAWWFFAFPLEACDKIRLPMPFFIRGDDQEFGVRLQQRANLPLLTPPGIAVWHEPFHSKPDQTGWPYYFGFYNNLIMATTAEKGPNLENIPQEIEENFVNRLLRRKDYSVALAVLGAVEDYLKGPEFLMKTPVTERMPRAKSFDLEFGPSTLSVLPHSPRRTPRHVNKIRKKIVRLLNYGHRGEKILKALGIQRDSVTIDESQWDWRIAARAKTLYVKSHSSETISVYKTNSVLYKEIEDKKKVLISELKKRIKELSEEFKKAQPELTSEDFWKNYLNIG